MTITPRILAATAQPGYPVLRMLLEKDADVVFAFTIDDALRKLRGGGFDLIICTIHFDDSRMFDFERLAHAAAPEVPFVCARLLDSILKDSLYEAMRVAVESLGGEFIDRQELHHRLGPEAGDREFTKRVLSRIPTLRAG